MGNGSKQPKGRQTSAEGGLREPSRGIFPLLAAGSRF